MRMSSSLALGPDTVLRVTTGMSTIDLLRKKAPGYVALLRKLAYVARKEHALSPGLKQLALKEFAPMSRVLPKGDLEKSLSEPKYTQGGQTSPWAIVLGGMQADGNLRLDDTLVQICQWMQACDEHGFYAENLQRAGLIVEAESHLASLLGPALEVWKELNPNLAIQALVAIEVPLMAVARLDYEWAVAEAKPGSRVQSSVISLLEPTARPLGHWLRDVCSVADCRNLGELSTALLRARALFHGKIVSHERLKKWARSKEVAMPPKALEAVLMAVPSDVKRGVLRNRFGAARLLTFLCDLVRSSTIGAAPTWADAQGQISCAFAQAIQNQAVLHSSRSSARDT